MTAFPTLFSDIRVGSVTLPNRLMMGSMHTNLESRDDETARLAAFYAARARGGASLLVTGGYGPNMAGNVGPHDTSFMTEERADTHRELTDAVHEAGGRILLQVLHTGRYGYHDRIVAPSPIRSPINRDTPHELSDREVRDTIADFTRCAALAKRAGYDGVEIMGSEGYLITQFLAPRTNHREDDWGGSLENRARFPLEVVRATRRETGDDFMIMFRLSVLDLVEDALSVEDTVWLARQLEDAGTDIFDTGIGWHEARVPTIANSVPRGAFVFAVDRIKQDITKPIIATNRINTPEVAERVLAEGRADMVSLARPMLADPDFGNKARDGASDLINTCIACNQACLDHYFVDRAITCIVNPVAMNETRYDLSPSPKPKRVAVVGAGPGGLACATAAAERGHTVTLYEKAAEIGGQFNLAKVVPGKEEFAETIRHFGAKLDRFGVEVKLETEPQAETLGAGFDEVVIATGVNPRRNVIAGEDHPSVVSYLDVLSGRAPVGEKVAIVGAGGIGFDVALYLVEKNDRAHLDAEAFLKKWGIERDLSAHASPHQVTMLQRSEGAMGKSLGRTTGWIHKIALRNAHVRQLSGVAYDRIDDEGLHITHDGQQECLDVDTIVLCAGQEENAALMQSLDGAGARVHVIGGAKQARELDAMRAIEEGVRLATGL